MRVNIISLHCVNFRRNRRLHKQQQQQLASRFHGYNAVTSVAHAPSQPSYRHSGLARYNLLMTLRPNSGAALRTSDED